MKKLLFLFVIMVGLTLSGCEFGTQEQPEESDYQETSWEKTEFDQISAGTGGMFEKEEVYNHNKQSEYTYNWQMEQPNLEDMENFEAITEWYTKEWTKQYTPDEETIQEIKNNEKCQEWVEIENKDTQEVIKTVSLEEFTDADHLKLTDKYQWDWYAANLSFHWTDQYMDGGPLDLSDNALDFFEDRGWLLLDPHWQYISYEWEWDDDVNKNDFYKEWVAYINAIWWESEDYRRYPYNTLFVTSDLLLHMYYTIFSDNLKYYEQSFMRKNISELADNFYDKFVDLYQDGSDEQLKEHYEFLVGYWAIASSLLINEQELLASEQVPHDPHPNGPQDDLDDEEIHNIVKAELEEKINVLSDDAQQVVISHLEEILKSEQERKNDILLEHYYPNLFTDHEVDIVQDYTQFQPRSHYTTNSLLKTYFMWLQFLMREKFYFLDEDLTKTALIQVNNISDDSKEKFSQMHEFVEKLVWEDDDINIYDIQNYLEENNLDSDSNILEEFDQQMHEQLQNLKPQHIISTSYDTDEFFQITEEQAHQDTVGFVFFGERTTIDSWIYDQLTAGSAEKEAKEKPPVTTANSIPHILSENDLAWNFVGEFLETWATENDMLDREYHEKYYDKADGLIDQVKYFDFWENIYHKWLDTLNYLFIQDENDPYFVQDELYQQKNLVTYLGSYTELKHATLLYVKQAYAELGWGWWRWCTVEVEPPSLSVPKGYIEPNIELIDRLIYLSKKTNEFYDEDNKFDDFIQYLEFIRQIAVAQTKNEEIPDEDFEKLRLYHKELREILVPNKYIWQPLQKEERGSLVADIFTSGDFGALYNAIWRPQLIMVMIEDVNWPRIAVGPVYTPYEFYWEEVVGEHVDVSGRLTDENWQNAYDELSDEQKDNLRALPFQNLYEKINKWE